MAHMVIDCSSLTLAFFDPASLAEKRAAEPKWMKDASAVRTEEAAGRVATVRLPEPRASFSVEETAATQATSPTGTLKVPSGTIYFGDVTELPSRSWGKRRWNAWDWLFIAFIVSLVPFGLWFAGFDRELLKMLLVIGALTVIASTLIALVVFRSGGEFARRTGTPPEDRPHQTLQVAPGEYLYWVEPAGDLLAIRFSRAPGQ